jgi:hypothetical protein
LSSPARQIASAPAPEKRGRESKKEKRLKKRVVSKPDGRYLVYYEKP